MGASGPGRACAVCVLVARTQSQVHSGALALLATGTAYMEVLVLTLVSTVLALRGRSALGLDHRERLIGVRARGDPVPTDASFAGVLDPIYEHHFLSLTNFDPRSMNPNSGYVKAPVNVPLLSGPQKSTTH